MRAWPTSPRSPPARCWPATTCSSAAAAKAGRTTTTSEHRALRARSIPTFHPQAGKEQQRSAPRLAPCSACERQRFRAQRTRPLRGWLLEFTRYSAAPAAPSPPSSTTAAVSFFANVELVPGDPILGLTEAYNADSRATKVNLGVGIYYDEDGRIPVLQAVQRVERQLAEASKPRGYLPIDGMPDYTRATRELLFGAASPLVVSGRASTTQTVGGSGALRVGAELLKKSLPFARIAISNPSWENHRAVFGAVGFEVVDYTYFDAAAHGLDFDGMLADLRKLEAGTVVLLHACCHNPTGADLTAGQWEQVIALLHERRLFPFIDMAYQGFDRGIDEDAHAIRLLAQSPIRNF